MHIHSAEFLLGAARANQFPTDELPEIAFAGRSNVGKSSLLNRLLNRKRLARVSQTPGCTRQLNFMLINRSWRCVDLPGYGFAKVGRHEAHLWQETITVYLKGRRQLRAVVLILDPRRGLTEGDLMLIHFMNASGIPYLPVATKLDKMGSNEGRRLLAVLTTQMQTVGKLAITPPLACSSLTGAGFDRLWHHLAAVLDPYAPATAIQPAIQADIQAATQPDSPSESSSSSPDNMTSSIPANCAIASERSSG